MIFNTGSALLDAIVLAVVEHSAEGTYGYKITQDVRSVIDVSESTLYPVLRRLQRMIVSLCMIRNAAAETAVTIKSQKGAGYSLTSTDRNGTTTHIRSISFFWNKLTQP